jgi:hypothetical protein
MPPFAEPPKSVNRDLRVLRRHHDHIGASQPEKALQPLPSFLALTTFGSKLHRRAAAS